MTLTAQQSLAKQLAPIRLLVVAFVCLCFSGVSHAQGTLATFPVWRITPAGAFPAGGAAVTICAASATGTPCLPTVTVYSDAGLTLPAANPLAQCTAPLQFGCLDNFGNAYFYATPGNYSYSVTGAGLLSYGPIPLQLPCVVGLSCVSTSSPNTFTQPQTFGAQIVSTVATGTAPFSIASTTIVPNLNVGLLGGLAAPGSAIVGLTDSQALANKTFDISLNTLKNGSNTAGHFPRNNGTKYVDSAIQAADMPVFVASGGSHAPGAVPDPGSSAGTTRFLREDATWAAPSAGGGVSTVYNTTASAVAAAIGSTTMVTAPALDTNYLFSVTLSETGATLGCSIAPSSGVTLTYTDPFNNSAAGATVPLANASTATITSTAAWGTVTNNTTIWHFTISFRAKASTAVSYAVSYNVGSGCSTGASYSVAPVLVQE